MSGCDFPLCICKRPCYVASTAGEDDEINIIRGED